MSSEIVHVVLVRWAATGPADIADRIDRAVRSVRDTVPGVVEIGHGPSVSVEHLERGYTYGLYVRFADAAARDGYLPHPAHEPLAELITTHSETFLVFDLAVPPSA